MTSVQSHDEYPSERLSASCQKFKGKKKCNLCYYRVRKWCHVIKFIFFSLKILFIYKVSLKIPVFSSFLLAVFLYRFVDIRSRLYAMT